MVDRHRHPRPGATNTSPDTPVTGTPLAPVPLPELLHDGKISADRAEAYLAAVLTNSGHAEIARVYAYNDRSDRSTRSHPGVGVVFHNGARGYMAFAHTARSGPNRGRDPYRLQSEF